MRYNVVVYVGRCKLTMLYGATLEAAQQRAALERKARAHYGHRVEVVPVL